MTTGIRVGGVCMALILLSTPWARAGTDPILIKKAVDHGVVYLRSIQQKSGEWPYLDFLGSNNGATALAALTLLECGVPASDQAVELAAGFLREQAISEQHTYSISLMILFFDRLGEPGDVPLIESLTVRLLAGQNNLGGWTYNCPGVGDLEERRLRGQIKQPQGAGNEPRDPAKRRAYQDLPEAIREQLALADRQRINNRQFGFFGGDNSNTQFATLALWVGHKYGLPVENAFARLESRYRTTQTADGGWGYQPTPTNATPSMTCAGLLGLAVAQGLASENFSPTAPKEKEDKTRTKKTKKKPEAGQDANIKLGLLALAHVLRSPFSVPSSPRIGPIAPAPGPAGRFLGPQGQLPDGINYYFLWSLERVAVAYGLTTIGKIDWYEVGSKTLLTNQRPDGSWRGGYPSGGVDTCFALLFLRRANLALDLTAALRGKVSDPGVVQLKAGGIASPQARSNPSLAEEGGPNGPKLSLEGARNQREPRAVDEGSIDDGIRSISDQLVQARPDEQESLIGKLRDGKGVGYTQALAAAIPDLHGAIKGKAREALAERLSRMAKATLRDKLQDASAEVRRAAALACAIRDEKECVPDLVKALEDREATVARAAHAALKSLSGEDFGPSAAASSNEIAESAAKWRSWWAKKGRN